MPPEKVKLVKGKSGAYGLTTDGTNVDVLQPEARFLQGDSGAWGVTTDGGKTVDILDDFDTTYLPDELLLNPKKKEQTPVGGSGASVSTTNPAVVTPVAELNGVHAPADATAIEMKLPTLAPELYSKTQKAKQQAASGGKQAVDLNAANVDTEAFAQKLVAKYQDGKYIDTDGKERTTFNEGDIVSVPPDADFGGKKYPGGYVQYVNGQWYGTQAPNPTFVTDGGDAGNATVVGYAKRKGEQQQDIAGDTYNTADDYNEMVRVLRKPSQEITDGEFLDGIHRVTKDDKDPLYQTLYISGTTEGAKKIPWLLLKNPEIIDAYRQEAQKGGGDGSSQGAYNALQQAVVKAYKLDESPWSGGDAQTFVDSGEFTRNVNAANKLLQLQQDYDTTAKLAETASAANKSALIEKAQGLQKQLSSIDPEALQTYFQQPQVKSIVDRTQMQQKGAAVLSQLESLFPERIANENALSEAQNKAAGAGFWRNRLYNVQALYYGAKSGIRDAANFTQNLAANIDGSTDFDRRLQQRTADVSKQAAVAKEYVPDTFTNEILHMVGNLAPTLPLGGIGGIAGKAATGIYFGATAAQQSLEQARAENLPDEAAATMAAVNGGLMAIIGFGLPEGGKLPTGFRPSMQAVEKVLNPALQKQGEREIFTELMQWKGGEVLKDVAASIRPAAEMKVLELINAGVNSTVNKIYGSNLNTDIAGPEDFAKTVLSFAIQRQAMKGFNALAYDNNTIAYLVKDAATGNIGNTIEALESLKTEPGANIDAITRKIDDLHRFAGIQFPDNVTADQKTAVYLQYEQKRQLQEAQAQSPQFASAYDGRIKEVDKRIAELLTQPEEAAKEVDGLVKPVQEQVQRGISVLLPERDETITKTIGENDTQESGTGIRNGSSGVVQEQLADVPSKQGGGVEKTQSKNIEEEVESIDKKVGAITETSPLDTPDYRIEKDGETYRIIEDGQQPRLATRGAVEDFLQSKLPVIAARVTEPTAPQEAETGSSPTVETAGPVVVSDKPVKSFETAKGSVYTYGEDGRTSRFKTATQEQSEPQDLIVFAKFKDGGQEQDFLSGVQKHTNGEEVKVVDMQGKIIRTNEEAKNAGQVRLVLVKDGQIIDWAETSTVPKEGYNTFDQRRYEQDGEKYTQSHLGNVVTKINYREPVANESTTIPQVAGTETPTGEAVVSAEQAAVEGGSNGQIIPEKVKQLFSNIPSDNNYTFIKAENSIWRRDNSNGEIIRTQDAPKYLEENEAQPQNETVGEAERDSRDNGGGEISTENQVTQSNLETNANSQRTTEKTVTKGRAYDGTVRQEVKDALERTGLTREVKNQQETYDNAGKFVQEVGEDYALQAVRNKDVEGDNAISVYAHLIKATQDKALTETDPQKLLDLANHEANLIQEVDALGTFGGRIGSMFGYIYRNSDLSFNVEKKIQDYKKEFGEMPPETEAKFREIDAKLKETQAKLAEAEARAKESEDAFVKAVKERDARQPKRTNAERAKTLADNVRRLKTREMVFYDAEGNKIEVQTAGFTYNDIIELAAKAIEKTGEIADGIKVALERLQEQEWYGSLTDRDKEAVNQQVQGMFTPEPEAAARTEDGKPKISHAAVRAKVEAGAKNIDEVVEAFKNDYPDVSDRDIRDAVTKYGKTINPSKEQIEQDIRKLKRIGRIQSALEDIAEKKRPLRSGAQRDRLDAEERALQKQLNDAMKDLPIDTETEDKQLRTALDAAKRRIENHMEELQQAIDNQEAIVRSRRTLEADAELRKLQADRDALQKQYDGIFGEPELSEGEKKIRSLQKQLDRLLTGERPATKESKQYTVAEQAKIDDLKQQIQDEQVMQGLRQPPREPMTLEELRLGAIDRAIEEVERQIREGDLQPDRPEPLSTPAIEVRKQKLTETRAALKQLREDAGIIAERKLANVKRQTQAGIAEYERRIREKDFSEKVKKPTIEDSELIRLRAARGAAREEYDKEFEKARLAAVKRWSAEWWKDKAWGAYDLTRSLRATGEMSFVLMQGGMLSLSHPTQAARAFQTMWKVMRSKEAAEQWEHRIKAQEWYPAAKKAGLALTSSNAKLTAREELFNMKWTNSVWNMIGIVGVPIDAAGKKGYEAWKKANPAEALERAATGYLNTLRVQRYLDGVKILEERKAKGEGITEQDYKDVADVVNTLTGRGTIGRFEQNSEVLSKIFFSPRLWSSAIKTATPYGLYHFGKMTPTARKVALTDFSRYVGVTAGMVAMAAAGLNNDDNKDGVEFDPRSSDFGKIRIGDTRIDPWGGRIQQVILQSRLIMGVLGYEAYKDGKGELKKLGEDTKSPTMAGLLGTMATNKLAPTAAMLNRYLNTKTDKHDNRVDMYGQPYSFKQELFGNLYPIYWDTIKEMAADKDALQALDGLLLFYSFFGGGVNQYQQKAKTGGTVWK